MDNFQIETAQNVNIYQNVAGIGDRILAHLIDGVVIVAYFFLILFIFIGVDLIDDDSYLFLFFMVAGLPPFFYHLMFETFWNGQSIGKKVMRIRVVKLDGSKPAFSNYLLRWLLRLVDISIASGGVAVITILLNGKGQRLGDIAATTTVITEKKITDFREILLAELPENYTPKYPQVTVFTDREMQNIKSIYFSAKYQGNHNIILKLSEKLSQVMELNFDEKPIEFVDTVIKDYTFYTQDL